MTKEQFDQLPKGSWIKIEPPHGHSLRLTLNDSLAPYDGAADLHSQDVGFGPVIDKHGNEIVIQIHKKDFRNWLISENSAYIRCHYKFSTPLPI